MAIPSSVSNRGERKSRKSLQGIGLKKVNGITRVTMKRPRGVSIAIVASLMAWNGLDTADEEGMQRQSSAWRAGMDRWRIRR